MTGSVLEIAENGRHLASSRGFLVVKTGKTVLAQIPFDQIFALIVAARGTSYTHTALCDLVRYGVPVVLCGEDHLPVLYTWSADAHYRQSAIHLAQANLSTPKRKQSWQMLVKAKLRYQAGILKALDMESRIVGDLIAKVRSDDSTNREAVAAARYWKILFGKDFVRDRTLEGVNALLNYGYTILRATTARAVMGAGLHPAFSLHHRQGQNPLRLVDDLMEPFRPLVDIVAYQAHTMLRTKLDASVKRIFVSLLHFRWGNSKDTDASDLSLHIHRLATLLAQVCLDEADSLVIPPPPTKEELEMVIHQLNE